jgi:hypothetical protein
MHIKDYPTHPKNIELKGMSDEIASANSRINEYSENKATFINIQEIN